MSSLLNGSRTTRSYPLGDELLQLANSDAAGICVAGRAAEIDALRRVGYADPVLGRIYEGHLNGAQLVARWGTPEQRARLEREVCDRRLFGVWNTQGADPVRVVESGGRFRLSGAKTFASGAGTISRAIVTAADAGGALQMFLVPMDDVTVEIDRDAWHPLGMERSDSFTVCFDGVELSAADAIGAGDDYARQPWFFGGALRFLAVQTGILERLTVETLAFLTARKRQDDPFQIVRAAQARVALETCLHWLRAGTEAWLAFDAAETPPNAERVIEMVDMARVVVERAALETLEGAVRSVGAHGLLEPLPFAQLVRDLQMYLRQPAPDAVLTRVGLAAFRAASAARNPASDSSTGTSS
jgi:alkylation response protein AidB-like acyl-CoA dehydrogenase